MRLEKFQLDQIQIPDWRALFTILYALLAFANKQHKQHKQMQYYFNRLKTSTTTVIRKFKKIISNGSLTG